MFEDQVFYEMALRSKWLLLHETLVFKDPQLTDPQVCWSSETMVVEPNLWPNPQEKSSILSALEVY